MKIIDLFSGIGGFSLGFQRAGYHFTEHYFSEIDKHAIANYKNNFPNVDIVELIAKRLKFRYEEKKRNN